MPVSPTVLTVHDLKVVFNTPDGVAKAVRGVDFSLNAGECLGIVGESGSGKSQSALAIMGLLAANGVATGSVRFNDREILNAHPKILRTIRGSDMAMVFQNPLTSLTPHMTVGSQMCEVLRRHKGLQGEAARTHCIDWLERVRIPEAKQRMMQFPHQLSGGMRQRVMIAIAMLCEPQLLLADEPTTALDMTVQAQVLDLINQLKDETGTGVVLITHDMGVVARMCDRVAVMRCGEIVEQGLVDTIFHAPEHDYTRMLLDAVLRIDKKPADKKLILSQTAAQDSHDPVLQVNDLKVHFPVKTGSFLAKPQQLRAVDGVHFDLRSGETLGIVGESGCGKSTLARAVLKLLPATGGTIVWMGKDITESGQKAMNALRDDLQIVFQDPMASLDPRMTIGQSIAEPLTVHRPEWSRQQREAAVQATMQRVCLDPVLINRYPHELSGGQNQRAGIARAMIVEPRLMICDEAVSALDVSVQAQIVDLLVELQESSGAAMLFISHDLSVVREVSHRVMVLYLGRVVELAGRDAIYENARHPYTRALISAVPVPDPRLERTRESLQLQGDLPSPMDRRASLRFLKSRLVDDADVEQYVPKLIEVSPGHFVAEHDPFQGSDGLRA